MSESQKFIARNRAPRVQIEYDVELYGSEKKVQLPFVVGVMSDLAGKSQVEQPQVADRKPSLGLRLTIHNLRPPVPGARVNTGRTIFPCRTISTDILWATARSTSCSGTWTRTCSISAFSS